MAKKKIAAEFSAAIFYFFQLINLWIQKTHYSDCSANLSGLLLKKSIEKKMKFEQDDMERLIPYVELARQFLQFIHININKHLDEDKIAMATELEESIDLYRKNLKKLARKRLESGADVKSELLYLDIVRQIEKIGDHAFSISSLLAQTI